LLPPDSHGVKFVLSVDASAVATCLCRSHRIESGDTFGEIARRQGGDARFLDEIRLLNAGVDPYKLMPGDRISIPPRARAADSRATSRPRNGADACWVLFTLQWNRSGRGLVKPILEGEPIRAWGEGLRVVAVPRDKLLWFLGLAWEGIHAATALPKGTVGSEVVLPARFVSESDPTHTIEKRVTLTTSKDQPVGFVVEEWRFDAKGNRIAPRDWVRDASLPSLPIVLIAVSAILTALGLALRRRAERGRAAA
jgi:hypothetical protein